MNDLTKNVANSLHRARLVRGWSLARTAAAAGISRTTLTHLEAGTGNPTVETVWALSQALGVPVGELLEPEAPSHSVVVRHRDDEPLTGETMDVRLLAQPSGMASIDILDVRLRAGSLRRSEPHAPGTVEHIYVHRGRLRVGPLEKVSDLEPGDYASFHGDEAHLYEAPEGDTEAIIVICYPPNMLGLPTPRPLPTDRR